MTSVYEKMYPQIPATAPPDDESYRLKKIDELEKFLRTEISSPNVSSVELLPQPSATLP